MTTTTDIPRWVKSSYSDNGGNCVEVAANLAGSLGMVPVRDSKVPGGSVLRFPVGVFASFIAGVKTEEFGAI